MRDIEDGLARSAKSHDFTFKSKMALRVRDLTRSLLDYAPQIVHFSGHGAQSDGIVLEDDKGESVFVATEALANLFSLHKDSVHCVVLNACYSEEQAKAISRHIPYVVGMNNSVGDDSAAAFAVGFYDALGAGRPVQEAFKHGRNAIELYGLADVDLPVLLHSATGDESGQIRAVSESETAISKLLLELRVLASESTQYVHSIGMSQGIPFDSIYQPTKLLFRSGLNISASAAFGRQNRIAQSIALSRSNQFRSLTVESFLESPEDTVIFAGPGWGKTTFLHHIYRRKSSDSTWQTVLITLRRDEAVSQIKSLVDHWITLSPTERKKVFLLVDGYDEIAVADRKLVSHALSRFRAHNIGRFILTCREFYQVIDLNFSEVRIDSFDLGDEYRFVQAFLTARGSSLNAIALVNELEERQFSDFLSHPLLLSLACIISTEASREQSRSALRLLKKALNTLQNTWDSSRGISRERKTFLEGEDRMQILKKIANSSSTPFLRAERVENLTRLALDNLQVSKVNPRVVLEETAQFYGILVPSGDGYEFVHRTIQDYLAAQHMVDSGAFASRASYDWTTRTAYAACLSGDATKLIEQALASDAGLTCAIETLSNNPAFNSERVTLALVKFYTKHGRVAVFERTTNKIAAEITDDLFSYFTPRFLNHLIGELSKQRAPIADALIGACLSELRYRKLRLEFAVYDKLLKAFNDPKFQFRIAERESVTIEMARPLPR